MNLPPVIVEVVVNQLVKRTASLRKSAIALAFLTLLASCSKSSTEQARDKILEDANRNAAEIIRNTAEQLAEDEKDLAKLQKKQLEQQMYDNKAAAERTQREADAKLAAIQKAEASRMARQQEQEQSREEQQKKREQEAAMIAAKKAELAAKEQMASTEKAEAKKLQQVELAKTAERLFAAVRLQPEVVMSPAVSKTGASVEIKGERLAPLSELIKNRDWLGLFIHIDRARETEFPNQQSLENARNDLGRVDLKLVLKTSYRPKEGDDALYSLLLNPRNDWTMDFGIQELSNSTNLHPDNIGFVQDWTPSETHAFFFLGNRESKSKVYAFKSEYRASLDAMDKKVSLGEMSKEQYQRASADLNAKTINEIREWVTGQSTVTDESRKRFSGIALFSGGEWKPLGNGLRDVQGETCEVLSIAHLGTDTYAATIKPVYHPSGKGSLLSRWDGKNWNAVEGLDDVKGIAGMASSGGKLYIHGTKIGSFATFLRAWTGTKWEEITEPADGVRFLSGLEDGLYIGGSGGLCKRLDRSGLHDVSPTPLDPTSLFEGFGRFENKLVAAGKFRAAGTLVHHSLAVLAGNAWVELNAPSVRAVTHFGAVADQLYILDRSGPLHRYSSKARSWDQPFLKSGVNANCIAAYGNKLAVGTFNGLFFLNGDEIEKTGASMDHVTCLSTNGIDLWVGGAFRELRLTRADSTPQ